MKKILFALALVGANFQGTAQVTISPVAGLNMTGYTISEGGTSYTDDIKMKPRVCAGALVDFSMKNNWSLQTGLLFKGNGYRSKVYDQNGNIAEGEFADLRVSTLDLPVKVTYSFPMSKGNQFFIGAGPYLAMNISANQHVHAHYYDNAGNPIGIADIVEKVSIGRPNGLQRMDMGAGLNAGFRAKWGLLVCLQGQYGLLNLSDGNATVHNYNFGVVAGYSFKLKKHKIHAEGTQPK